MKRYIPKPTLRNFVARYKTDKRLLEKYSDDELGLKYRKLLEKRIKRHEQDIIDYVTSDQFEAQLKYLYL